MTTVNQNGSAERRHSEYIIGVILIGFLIAHLASMVYKAEPADIVPQEYLKKLNHNTKWFLITIYFLFVAFGNWIAYTSVTRFLKIVGKGIEQLSFALMWFVIDSRNFEWRQTEHIIFWASLLFTFPIVWYPKLIEQRIYKLFIFNKKKYVNR